MMLHVLGPLALSQPEGSLIHVMLASQPPQGGGGGMQAGATVCDSACLRIGPAARRGRRWSPPTHPSHALVKCSSPVVCSAPRSHTCPRTSWLTSPSGSGWLSPHIVGVAASSAHHSLHLRPAWTTSTLSRPPPGLERTWGLGTATLSSLTP